MQMIINIQTLMRYMHKERERKGHADMEQQIAGFKNKDRYCQ